MFAGHCHAATAFIFLAVAACGNSLPSPLCFSSKTFRRLDKGLSGSDVPHHVVVTLLYELHKFKTHRALDAVLGGWKLGVLETYESGPSFTVITTANSTNIVETSTNFTSWRPVITNVAASGTFTITDAGARFSIQFYRVRKP